MCLTPDMPFRPPLPSIREVPADHENGQEQGDAAGQEVGVH